MGFETTSDESVLIVLDELFELTRSRPQDAAADRRFALDPDAARFLGWTVEQARSAPDSHYEEGIRRSAREWRERQRFALIIRRRSDGEAVGAVELRPCGGEEADVSYMVAADLRGQGLAPKALEAMLAWGRRELGLRRANLCCHVDNVASQRVAEKCGFAFVGHQRTELHFRRDIHPPEA